MKIIPANILTTMEEAEDASIIDYSCPKCEEVHSGEMDMGQIKCACGIMLDCNIMNLTFID